MGQIRAVLFDLDGTLLDTAPDLIAALNHVRQYEGHTEAPVEQFRALVSQGALGLLKAGMPPADDHVTQRRRQRFLDFYAQNSLQHTVAFDGVEPLLAELESRAIAWGIVTNKPEYLTHPVVAAFGWTNRAGTVVCGDTLSKAKPHPDPIWLACEQLAVRAQDCLMVGDDVRDIEAAIAARATPVLAAYGYGAAQVLSAAEVPAHIARTPAQVLPMVLGDC